MSRLGKVSTLTARDWDLLRRALVAVAHIRIALWILPWRRLAESMDTPFHATRATASPARLEWAVKVASRAVPRATCLTQALALYRLLAHDGYQSTVQVGARNADGQFDAHAWVEHDGQLLLGTSADVARYSRLFAWPDSRDHS